jgi:hypothetical protein
VFRENFSGFATVLKRSTFSSWSSCSSSFSVAINFAAASTRKPKCTRFLFSHEARHHPSLRERERERRLLGFRVQGGGGGIPPPLYVDAKSSHTDDKFIHPNSIFCFLKSKKSKLEFSFLQKKLK